MSTGPWRDVVHVEDCTGPRGGEHWLLTLSCGHHKARGKPRYQLHQFRKPPRFAPKRTRCLVCPTEVRR